MRSFIYDNYMVDYVIFLVEFNVIKLIKKKARNYKLIKKKC